MSELIIQSVNRSLRIWNPLVFVRIVGTRKEIKYIIIRSIEPIQDIWTVSV